MAARSLLAALATWAVAVSPTFAEPTKSPPHKAAERGLEFLIADAAKWRAERTCATCHHGTMTVWALSEAKSQGFAVEDKTFAETVKWTKERLKDIEKPRDTRPGWSMVNSPAVYLAVMALAVPKQDAVSADDLKKIAGHLVRHQEAEGNWAWSLAPAKNRPPPFFESDEVVTLLAELALSPQAKENAAARASRDKGTAWLAKATPTGTTQALAFRLFRDVCAGAPAKTRQADIERLLARQNKDGGWGQLRGAASDAYATGQTLYFLRQAGMTPERAELRSAVDFLVKTQRADGSWPMKRRGQPGVTPGDYIVPITYFGSAWATLGLMRGSGK